MPSVARCLPLFVVSFCFWTGCSSDSVSVDPPAATRSDERPDVRAEPVDTAVAPDDWFEDVTARSGVQFAYKNGMEAGLYTLVESMGGGVAVFDFDGDGLCDLFFAPGGHPGRRLPPERIEEESAGVDADTSRPALFRNKGGGQFDAADGAAGFVEPLDYSYGAFAADYDNDGFADVFVTAFGKSRLFHNAGDGTFHDVTKSFRTGVAGWFAPAAWGDMNRDGLLDLFVGAYAEIPEDGEKPCINNVGIRDVCTPAMYRAARSRLLINAGDGSFRDESETAGLTNPDRALGAVALDVNADGWMDLYVANDTIENRLLLGGPQFPLRDEGTRSGTAYSDSGAAEGSMGVDAGDYNGDGRVDLFVVNYEHEDNALYRQDGDGVFTHQTVAARLNGPCRALVGFGTGFADFDLDGWQDLFIINGHVMYRGGEAGYRQPAFVYRNQNGATFENVSARAGAYFRGKHAGRGAAVADLDDDGLLDLVAVHQNDPAVLLRNRQPARDWIRLTLRGQAGNRDAIGAAVRMHCRGRTLVRWIRGGGGYLSTFDPRVLLPAEPGQELVATVDWPGGRSETFSRLRSGRTNVLIEGSGHE